MSDERDQALLGALLDSWDRNNTILVNLLRTVPEGGLEVRAMQGSPSVAGLFTHIHYVRLVLVSEDAPEFAEDLPAEEWVAEREPARIAQMLNESARVVRDAVKGRLEAGRDMDLPTTIRYSSSSTCSGTRVTTTVKSSSPSSRQAARSPTRRPGRSRGGYGCERVKSEPAVAAMTR